MSIYWVELFIPPWLLVIGVSRTALIVGGFRSKASLALLGKGTVSSAVRCGSGRLLSCLIVGIHASGIPIPLSLLILLWWSLVRITYLTTRVPVRVSVNKLNLLPERIMPGFIGAFRNAWVGESRLSLSCSLTRSCMYLPVSPMHIFSHSQWVLYNTPYCLRG